MDLPRLLPLEVLHRRVKIKNQDYKEGRLATLNCGNREGYFWRLHLQIVGNG